MTARVSLGRRLSTVFLVFVVLEVTAAVWHLLLFRRFYAAETAVMDRGFQDYVVPHLLITNLLRAAALVGLFEWTLPSGAFSRASGVKLGMGVGLVSGLLAAEYYGVWRFRSFAWPLMEGAWLVAQGAAVGLSITWAFAFRRSPQEEA